MKKIAVFGAGGIGGYFGARLAAGGADVHLLARGAHLEALRKNGLRVESGNGNLELRLPATDSPEEIGSSDLVLFCVKSTDTDAAASRLGPLLGEETAVLSLQNGVDNEERIAAAVGWERVIPGAAYILATIAEPGAIRHDGKLARIVFGEVNGAASERCRSFLDLCRASGIDAELSSDIRLELWRKFAMICATAGMTAAVRLPVGEIREAPAAFAMYRRILTEVHRVAAAEGIALSDEAVEKMLELWRNIPGNWTSSLHYDLTHGKPMELEALHGTVVRRARARGIEAPMCEAVYAILEPWALRNH